MTSIKRSKMENEVGVADKFCRSSLNLVEKFEVALGCTGPIMRTIFQMGPDEGGSFKRQQLGGKGKRPNDKQKVKFLRCHRSNTVDVLFLGKAAVNGESQHIKR